MNNYYRLVKEYKRKKSIYYKLTLEEKIDLMNLELKINYINIKDTKEHTKAENRKKKIKNNERRKADDRKNSK
ncbi:hypothetical protein [Clostridium cadaveris]|uniref:hypothetical protein n=1 Tax=Clostridium cadaveris TaxID=1529 RepID=UPI001E354A34|nr:hypothetical protein [Clostridium cadaveris]UFH66452.1 hypothetical protein KQH81_08000 [Clostridium cadaveris]